MMDAILGRDNDEVKEMIDEHVLAIIDDNDLDIVFIDSALHGSRLRGTARSNSDLDYVFEYAGNMKEDAVFNIMNDEPYYIEHVQIDINPIRKQESGNLERYMKKSNLYDKEVLSRMNESYGLEDIPVECGVDDDPEIIEMPDRYTYRYFGNCRNTVDVDHMWDATLMSGLLLLSDVIANREVVIENIEDGDRKIPVQLKKALRDINDITIGVNMHQLILFIYVSSIDIHFFFDVKPKRMNEDWDYYEYIKKDPRYKAVDPREEEKEIITRTMSKKALYEKVMLSVAKLVKKALNENKWENLDHKHNQEVMLKPLCDALMLKGYDCRLLSKSYRESTGSNYELKLFRNGQRSNVKLVRKKMGTATGQLLLLIADYNEEDLGWVDDNNVNEVCIIIPPAMNNDPHGTIIDNTKACFFDKEELLNAYVNNELKSKLNRSGKFIAIPERWAKEHAKEMIAYKDKR